MATKIVVYSTDPYLTVTTLPYFPDGPPVTELPVWAAASSEYMVTGSGSHELQAQYIGEGTPTFTHSGLLLPDHEGVYYEIEEDTAPWHGARAAVQQAPKTNALDTWLKVSVTVATGIADPDGGNTAVRVTSTSSAGALRLANIKNFPTGNKVRASWWIRRVAGTADVQIYNGRSADLFTVPVTSDWTRVTADVADAFGNAYMGVWLSALDDAVDVWHPMYEIVTGQANQNPSEYVENTSTFNDSTASKFYSNANGNTVTDNVVTEAEGAPLAVAPSLYAAPAMTNLIEWSADGTTWSGGSTDKDVTAVGLTGEPNSATVVTATATLNARANPQGVTTVAGSQVMRIFAKAGTASWMSVDGANYDPGAVVSAWFDLSTGTVGTLNAGIDAAEINAVGDWYECLIEFTTTTDLIGNPRIAVTTGDNTFSAVIGEDLTIGNFEYYGNATMAQVRGSAPIVTEGAAVTNSTVTLRYDLANHDNQQGAYYNEYTPFSADQGLRTDIIGLRNNTTLMYGQSNERIYTSDGVTSIISPTGLNGATANKLSVGYDATAALKYINQDGSSSIDNPYSGSFPTDLGYIGVINNTRGANLIRNIQRWDLPYDEAKAKIDSLMGS